MHIYYLKRPSFSRFLPYSWNSPDNSFLLHAVFYSIQRKYRSLRAVRCLSDSNHHYMSNGLLYSSRNPPKVKLFPSYFTCPHQKPSSVLSVPTFLLNLPPISFCVKSLPCWRRRHFCLNHINRQRNRKRERERKRGKKREKKKRDKERERDKKKGERER